MCSFASKIVNSAPVQKIAHSKAFSKAVDLAGAASLAMATLAVQASAEGGTVSNVIAAEVNSGDIIANAQPFVTPAIGILCVVGGIKLGMRFLRSSMH